jgi:hypothetical protein
MGFISAVFLSATLFLVRFHALVHSFYPDAV